LRQRARAHPRSLGSRRPSRRWPCDWKRSRRPSRERRRRSGRDIASYGSRTPWCSPPVRCWAHRWSSRPIARGPGSAARHVWS